MFHGISQVSSNPGVSVIISNFNGARYLPRLLETLRSQQDVKPELIVVDRNSTDESNAILAQHPEVKVIKHPPETGLACGYAVGAEHATEDFLFFCNEDMWFEPRCLKLLCESIDLAKRIGAVMPVQWTYDLKDIVNAGVWFQKARWNRSNPNPFQASRWHLVRETTAVSGVNAGACLIHRNAYDETGGWDRSFFLDHEDLDLSVRLWQHEWSCLVIPAAKVGHAVGASNSQNIAEGRYTVSRKRYIEGSSNVLAIALKTFTGPMVILPFFALLDRMTRDLLKCRIKLTWWDVLVFAAVMRRLPILLKFRRKNGALNRRRPGQRFFSEPRFDYSVIAGNRA